MAGCLLCKGAAGEPMMLHFKASVLPREVESSASVGEACMYSMHGTVGATSANTEAACVKHVAASDSCLQGWSCCEVLRVMLPWMVSLGFRKHRWVGSALTPSCVTTLCSAVHLLCACVACSCAPTSSWSPGHCAVCFTASHAW
jgi:hypothetical protein